MNYRYHESMFLNFYYIHKHIHKQAKKLKIVILNFFFTLILINNNLKIFFIYYLLILLIFQKIQIICLILKKIFCFISVLKNT